MRTAVLCRFPFCLRDAVILLCLAAWLLMLGGNPARSGEPEDVVRGLSHDVVSLLSSGKLDDANQAVELRRILNAHFELDRISRFVMGKHWRKATAEQRGEYRELFEDYLLAFYSGRLERYSGERLAIRSTKLRDSGAAVVSSRLGQADQQGVALDWRLMRAKGGWRIVDLVVEGVSLTATQRAEFDAVITRNGGRIEPLLATLRDFNS